MPWKNHIIEKQIEITNIYSLFEYHFDSTWNFEGEAHDFWECVYVINGEIRVSGDGRVYTLKSGEMIFHKPMEFHKLSLLGLSGADVFIFSYKANGILVPYFNEKVFNLSNEQKCIILSLLHYLRDANKGTANKVEKEFLYLDKKKLTIYIFKLLYHTCTFYYYHYRATEKSPSLKPLPTQSFFKTQ